MLGAAAAVALGAALATTAASAASLPALAATAGRATAVTPVVPAPTGRYQVGVVNLHLVDKSRIDPWVPGNRPRELMVSLWYPTNKTSGHALAPWMESKSGARFLTSLGARAGTVNLPTTAGHLSAPVDTGAGKLPVLLYIAGLHADRSMGTSLVEDLASRGYLVVAIDDTHDATEVQFPGGRVETDTMPANAHSAFTVAVRAADARFVLNELTAINAGKDPDAEHASLPAGLTGRVDMNRVGMFGWSLGGAATATAMQLDPRIKAGADLDGMFFGSAMNQNLTRPFLLFSAQAHNRDTDSTWATFWSHLHGQRWDLKLAGTKHRSFSDNELLITRAAGALGLTPAQVQTDVGTLNPGRDISIQRTYVAAYFDQVLRGQHSTLLNGPSPRYPEVSFIR